jgi:hypothetical protein
MNLRIRPLTPALLLSLVVHAGIVLVVWCLPTAEENHEVVNPEEDEPDFHLQLAPAEHTHPTVKPSPQHLEEAHLIDPPLVSVSPVSSPDVPGNMGSAGEVAHGSGLSVETAGSGALLSPLVKGAGTVVFVLDRSVSMGPSGALARARRELAACLRALPEFVRFQVIPYNKVAEPLPLGGHGELVPAGPETVAEAIRRVEELLPAGATDHVRALRRALLFKPAVIVFLTDADDLLRQDIPALGRLNAGRARIHVIELNDSAPRAMSLLRQLAEDNGGTYRRIAPGGRF